MRRLPLTFTLAVALCLGASGCRNAETANGTAVFVTTLFPALSGVDQLRFSAQNGSGNLFVPQYRPVKASGALSSPQSVHLLLKDTAAGDVTVQVEGLKSGQVIGLGEQAVNVRLGSETSVDITLSPGQSCRCPGDQGCCSGTTCVTSPTKAQCGQGGATCVACDLRSDSCDAAGQCVCGSSGKACPEGQQCVGGQCECTPQSCPAGCCRTAGVGSTCDTSQTNASCGLAGQACDDCGVGSCDQGRCSNNILCNTTCAGCCSGSSCVVLVDRLNACGTSGAPCEVCDPNRSNVCAQNSACKCGSLPECPSGQRCVPGPNQTSLCR